MRTQLDSSNTSSNATSALPSQKQRQYLHKAIAEYSASVQDGMRYLAEVRGLTLEMAQKWRLGIVSEPLPGHERFKGRLAIPYRTPSGPVGMVFRCILDHDCRDHGGNKYDMVSGDKRRLFNVHALHVDVPQLVLCEGEMDAIAATSIGGVMAVGVPGARNWRSHWQYLFDGYDEVIVAADGDKDGKELAERVKDALSNARVVQMPDGHDVNSYLVEHGAEQFRKYIEVEGEE